METSMAPWWVTLLGGLVTGLLAWAAQAWAKRGKSPETMAVVNNVATGMLKDVVARLERVEAKADWRATAHDMDRDHIDLLESWVWSRKDPPPPARPVYPPRPQ
jgi:hypothetical protein